MQYKIENYGYTAIIDSLGAELRGIRCKADSHEYMWAGDPATWSGCAPILFPVVGRLKEGIYRYENRVYSMEKHGFARRSLFQACKQEDSAIEFTLESSEETLAYYPFPFCLTVRFTLEENRLQVLHRVRNTGQTPMWFSIGAHPGFTCNMGDLLRFERPEQVQAYRLQGGLLGNKEDFLSGEDCWKITGSRFDRDAYILEGARSSYITLERQRTSHGIRFHWRAPYLGIWSKPGADYICLEPWFGIDDSPAHNNVLEHKQGIQRLGAGSDFTMSYIIELL